MAIKEPTTKLPKRAKIAATGRISQPQWLNPAIVNGMGFVPRRGIGSETGPGYDSTSLRSIDQILLLARTQPLKVLTMLSEISPEIAKATWNGMRLGCGEDAVRIKAVLKTNGQVVTEAPEGTEAIKSMFKNLPPEVGSLTGALRQSFLMVMYSGMCAVEAVPGKRNEGIAQLWPIDTLTLRIRRDKDTGLAGLWQRQRIFNNELASKAYAGYIPLPNDRVFWSSTDGFPDDPYGRPPYAAVLQPVLEITAFMKDLLLAWHRVGTPKWDIGFDYEMHARVAKDIMGLSDRAEIEQYVEDEFNYVVNMFNSLEADDGFFHDIQSKVSVNGSGGAWPNVEEVYKILRWRLIMALKEMPTLMGVVEGNTETWSSVDWQIYAKGLEAMVAIASRPLIKAAELHLQLLGMPYEVEAEYQPVRANQRMVDAQSENIEIDNELQKILMGFSTQDEGSMVITGSKAVAPMDKEGLGLLKPEPKDAVNPVVKTGPSKGA